MNHLARLMAITLSAALSLGAGPTPSPFICTVNGAELLKPRIAPDAICAQIKQRIEAAITVRLYAVTALPKRRVRALRSFTIDVSIRKPGIVAAIITQQIRRTIKVHPEISIAVFDRAVVARDIDQLAREIARTIEP